MTSVSAFRKDSRFACRSRASSAQTDVNAHGWKTSSTLRFPRKSLRRTRGRSKASSRSNSGARSPVAIAIHALLSVAGGNIVGPTGEPFREVVVARGGGVLVR